MKKRVLGSGYPATPAKPAASPRASAADDVQEKVLILGGKLQGRPQKDILALGEENTNDPKIAKALSHDFSVCATDNAIIVSGGQSPESRGNSVRYVKCFSLATMSWTNLLDMPEPLSSHGSACVNNSLFTIGGARVRNYNTVSISKAVNSLELSLKTWIQYDDMPETLRDPGVAVVKKNILAIGGWNGRSYSKHTFKFNLTKEKWTTCEPTPRLFDSIRSTTASVSNKVFVLQRDEFFQYDVAIDQWSELARPPKPSSQCALVPQLGNLLALGGYESTQDKPNDRIQKYDVATSEWKVEETKMPEARYQHIAIAVPVSQK